MHLYGNTFKRVHNQSHMITLIIVSKLYHCINNLYLCRLYFTDDDGDGYIDEDCGLGITHDAQQQGVNKQVKHLEQHLKQHVEQHVEQHLEQHIDQQVEQQLEQQIVHEIDQQIEQPVHNQMEQPIEQHKKSRVEAQLERQIDQAGLYSSPYTNISNIHISWLLTKCNR